MAENAQKKNYLEIINSIDKFTRDADWSVEELREELLNEGINPDELIEKVRNKIVPFLSEIQETENEEIKKKDKVQVLNDQAKKLVELSPTLLSLLWQATKTSQSLIAQKLEVTILFMRGCSDFPDSVPEQCKQELINRAVRQFNFIDKSLIENIVRHPKQVATASFRDTSHSGKQMSFREIVEKSGMDEGYQKFWLDLAKGE